MTLQSKVTTNPPKLLASKVVLYLSAMIPFVANSTESFKIDFTSQSISVSVSLATVS